MSNVIAFPKASQDPFSLEEYEAIFGDQPLITINQKIQAAHQALVSYCGGDPSEAGTYGIQAAASDLFIDLLHLVDHYEIDLKTFVRSSIKTFKNEIWHEQ